MGIGPTWSCSHTIEVPALPNPDPTKFTILKTENINERDILLVKYEGCKTFQGKKLLLLRKHNIKIENLYSLDPHLLGKNYLVEARFEPNETGWALARLCANNHPDDKI